MKDIRVCYRDPLPLKTGETGEAYRMGYAQGHKDGRAAHKAEIARQALIERWGLSDAASWAEVLIEHETRCEGRIEVDRPLTLLYVQHVLASELEAGRI